MEIAVIIVSILLIAIVLLQSGKAESANIIQGGSSELFQNRKERGLELFISRLTFILGFTFSRARLSKSSLTTVTWSESQRTPRLT